DRCTAANPSKRLRMMNPHADDTSTLPLRPSRARPGSAARAAWPLAALSLCGLLHCGAPAAQTPAESPAPPEPERSACPTPPPQDASEHVVHAEFQTSAQAVKPKGKFLLAVRFDIQDGYRISWQNPGDVGKTTRV